MCSLDTWNVWWFHVNTLSVTVRYRPVRIGWYVRTGDFEALREALRFTFTMWGGHYNPVIPVDDIEFASSLVRLFRVDVIWPMSKDEGVKKFIDQFPHLPNPFFDEELFVPYGNGERGPQLVDIYHPIRRLYEEQFKNNPSPDTTVTIFEWQAEDPLADVLLATFGAVPPAQVTGTEYLALLQRHLSAKTVRLSPEEPFPQRAGNDWTVSTFCRSFIRQHYSVQNWWGYPGIYVGSASDFEDLVTFWNLRATDTPLMFYDPCHAERLEPNLTNWLDILRSRPKGRFESENSIAIWFREGAPQPDVSIFGQGLHLCTASKGVWNGLNVKAPYMYFSEGSVLATIIGEDSAGPPRVSFQLPQKPFQEDTRLYGQHLVVSVDPGIGLFGNERATLQAPYVPELNEYYGRRCYFEWDRARVEPGGMGVINDASRTTLSLTALDVVELVKRLFLVAGIDAEPSKPGLIAARLIQQMGGLQACRVFKIGGVRMLLETFGPDTSFNHKCAMQAIGGGNPQKGIPSLGEYKHLFIEPRPRGMELKPSDVFSYLLKKGVFRTGLEFDCPNCRLEFWVSLDDVRTEVDCEYCGHRFNITPHLHNQRNVWKYRRSGLFGREDNQEGAIPVILTLQQLHTTFHSREILYTTAMHLKPQSAAIPKCETDFVALVQRPLDGKIDIAIGECKTRKQIDDNDVNNLQAVADAFPSERFNVFVIFSKLNSFAPDELARTCRLNNHYRQRVILFTVRELEPYHLYERTAQEFKTDRYTVSFDDMANVTEQVFLLADRRQANGR
jgi:DNA-directed RNA polymerase subunit RPC12/RpoP